MIYRDPNQVRSPQDAISEVTVTHDGGEDGVSIARIMWYDEPVVGMRWNVSMREWDDPEKVAEHKECLGNPVSRGMPTWFILPHGMVHLTPEIKDALMKASEGYS